MADILEEQKNPISTTFKKMASYKANKPFKDPICQNKGLKYTENSRLSNRRKKLDKGSNHNIYPEENEETFKNVEIELKSNLDFKLKSFIYVIKNFDLDDNKSSCSISFLSFKNNIEDSKTEDSYLTTFNKSKKPLKQSPNKPDLLLYDIDITDHIVNDKKWFKNNYTSNEDQLKTLKIGGGPIILNGNGTAVFIILFQINPLKYRKIIFEDALYLPDIDVNLFNGLKHYKSRGYLEKNRLYTP